MKLGPERLALFASVLLLLAGYLFVFRPFEATIAERYAQLDDGRALLEQRLAVARRASDLTVQQRGLSRWLAHVGVRESRTTLVDRFLRTIAQSAAGDGVRITSVSADTVAPAAPRTVEPVTSTESPAPIVFDEIPLTVSLRGSYADLLRLVRDVNTTNVAARIGVDAIGNAERASVRDPELRATLHVTLLREANANRGPHAAD